MELPFIVTGPRGSGKTGFLIDFLVEQVLHSRLDKQVLFLTYNRLVQQQIIHALLRQLPEELYSKINVMSYYQLLKNVTNLADGAALRHIAMQRIDTAMYSGIATFLRDAADIVVFDQVFEASKYFPEMFSCVPETTKWCAAITAKSEMIDKFAAPGLVIKNLIQIHIDKNAIQSAPFDDHLTSKINSWLQYNKFGYRGIKRSWPRIIVIGREYRTVAVQILELLKKCVSNCSLTSIWTTGHDTRGLIAPPDLAILHEIECVGLFADRFFTIKKDTVSDIQPYYNEHGLQKHQETNTFADHSTNRKFPVNYFNRCSLAELRKIKIYYESKIVRYSGHRCDGDQEDWWVEIILLDGSYIRVHPDCLSVAI